MLLGYARTTMPKSTSVLQQYERIACISRQMLQHARANHWDEVVTLGEQYKTAVEALRGMDQLSPEDRLARRALLTEILGNDADIRTLAHPELARLGTLLGNIKRQHSVLQAYCGPALSP